MSSFLYLRRLSPSIVHKGVWSSFQASALPCTEDIFHPRVFALHSEPAMTAVTSIKDQFPQNWQLYLIILFFISSYTISTLRTWYRLRAIPGPWQCKISKLWLVNAHRAVDTQKQYYEMTKRYGSIVRVAPNVLLNSNPETTRKLLAVRSPYKRSDWYMAMRFDPTRDNVLSQRDDEIHRVLRAKMAPGYAGKENEDLESRIDANIAALVNLIDRKYISSGSDFRPMDLARKTSFFTLDVISDIAYGKPFGCLAADTDVNEYLQTTEEQCPRILFAANFPWLVQLLGSPLFRSLLPSTKDAIGFGRVMGIAQQVVGERFKPDALSRKDMLGSFVRNGLSEEECQSEVLVQIIAGSDTTATAIRMTLFYLISSPQSLQRFLDEIATLELRPGQIISDGEARKLPYLQAVIKEGLRIFPPVTGHMSKVVPAGGDMLNGFFVPEGTEVGTSVWGMQRDRGFWGEDADVFRPERYVFPNHTAGLGEKKGKRRENEEDEDEQ